eukprot:723321_1
MNIMNSPTYWVPVYVSLAVMLVLACIGCVVIKEREWVGGNGVHKQVAAAHKTNTGVMMLQVPNAQRDRVYSESQYEQNDDDEKEARDVVPGVLKDGGNNTGLRLEVRIVTSRVQLVSRKER